MAVAQALSSLFGDGLPVAFTAYDGSKAGPDDAIVTGHIRSVDALRHMVMAPGTLGMARAYVTGAIDIDGDVYTALHLLAGTNLQNLSWKDRLEIAKQLGPKAFVPIAPPPEEIRPNGRIKLGLKHAMRRDADAISHHYDVSNRFYEWVLGPSMAYTCAVYPTPDASLEEAQEAKVDLVCRKLGLKPGMRLLDVGCGWGLMVRHAAKHYGVTAIGATLSREQASWAQAKIEEEGLGDRAQVRFSDYRDIAETGFDAVSSIGLSEHIGHKNFPAYVQSLHTKLKPGGRLLNHCITRPDNHAGRAVRAGFINRYVFPDGELLSPGKIISELHDNGFEIRHEETLREHYAMTLRDWGRNLDDHWSEAVAEVGEVRARVWTLYMAGSRLFFATNRLQLHQVLCTRTEGGESGMALRPDW